MNRYGGSDVASMRRNNRVAMMLMAAITADHTYLEKTVKIVLQQPNPIVVQLQR